MNEFILLDLETTALEPELGDIIEAAALRVKNGKIIDTFDGLFKPSADLPPQIIFITKITEKDVANAPKWEEKATEFSNFIGKLPIVGQNVNFDINWLHAKNSPTSATEVATKEADILDTILLAQITWPDLPSHSLEFLSARLNLPHRAHRALGDCEATLGVLQNCAVYFSTLPQNSRDQAAKIAAKGGFSVLASFLRDPLAVVPKNFKINKINDETSDRWLKKSEKPLAPLANLLKKDEKIILGTFAKPHRLAATLDLAGGGLLVSKYRIPDIPHISDANTTDSAAISTFLDDIDTTNPAEIRLALKIICGHKKNGKTRHELGLRGEEHKIWQEKITPEPEIINLNEKIATVHPRFLAAHPKIIKNFDKIIIDDTRDLEIALTSEKTEKFTIDGDAATQIWEVYFTGREPEQFDVILPWENHKLSDDFWETLKTHENHAKITEIFKKSISQNLTRTVVATRRHEIILVAQPTDISPFFHEIFDSKPQILQIGSKNTEKYNRQIFDLDSRWLLPQITEKTPPERIFICDPTTAKDRNYLISILRDIFTTLPQKRTVIYFTSFTVLELATIALAEELENSGWKILSEKFGGTARTREFFADSPENTVLFCRFSFLAPHSALPITTRIFTKFPFDPPNDALLNNRARDFSDDFKDFTMARVWQKCTRDLLAPCEKQIFLDPTIEKRYFAEYKKELGIKTVLRSKLNEN